jgi:LPS export ABC transporter protein LptC
MRPRISARTAVAVALGALYALACDESTKQGTSVTATPLPDETVVEFLTQESDSGRVQWTLKAPRAERYNSRNVFVMSDPKIEFYDEMGNLQTTLTADNGEYSLATHDMLAYGNVVAVTFKGEVLETDSLRYLNAADKIVSDSFVKLTRGRDVVTGIGLECDHTLESVDIKKDVRARILEEDGKFDAIAP